MQLVVVVFLIMTQAFQLKGESNPKIVASLTDGKWTPVSSYMQITVDCNVADTFEQSANKQIAAFIYDSIIVNNLGIWFNNQIIHVLEILVQLGFCDKVFFILEEMHALSGGDEDILDKLQTIFSGSQIIFVCVRDTTVSQLLPTADFVAVGNTVAPQDPCVEATNCNFVLQATRFLLVPQLCDARRVCNFLGFEQREICQRECEN
eukprot:TRINITY_DN37190_c0_g1_i5.p2 TRINITY_DN37190_c0_g1~~TRINITY_DN37190_c0_g1_i5.p2  ORF type:complete len:206 (-),score=22.07 TRINITY_DN37190_c0_g1_i5:106-723(-)